MEGNVTSWLQEVITLIGTGVVIILQLLLRRHLKNGTATSLNVVEKVASDLNAIRETVQIYAEASGALDKGAQDRSDEPRGGRDAGDMKKAALWRRAKNRGLA